MLVRFVLSFLRLGTSFILIYYVMWYMACVWNFWVHICIIMFLSSWKNTLFPIGRIVTRLPTCRQVEISFLGKPQIALFRVEKWKSSLPWEGGHPPPPARSLRSLGLGRFAPSQRLCPPQIFWLITPLHTHVHTHPPPPHTHHIPD